MFQEPLILARVESMSAAEVGDLSHEITSLAAVISTDPTERNPACWSRAGFLGELRCIGCRRYHADY